MKTVFFAICLIALIGCGADARPESGWHEISYEEAQKYPPLRAWLTNWLPPYVIEIKKEGGELADYRITRPDGWKPSDSAVELEIESPTRVSNAVVLEDTDALVNRILADMVATGKIEGDSVSANAGGDWPAPPPAIWHDPEFMEKWPGASEWLDQKEAEQTGIMVNAIQIP